jgi:hypothetical protein
MSYIERDSVAKQGGKFGNHRDACAMEIRFRILCTSVYLAVCSLTATWLPDPMNWNKSCVGACYLGWTEWMGEPPGLVCTDLYSTPPGAFVFSYLVLCFVKSQQTIQHSLRVSTISCTDARFLWRYNEYMYSLGPSYPCTYFRNVESIYICVERNVVNAKLCICRLRLLRSTKHNRSVSNARLENATVAAMVLSSFGSLFVSANRKLSLRRSWLGYRSQRRGLIMQVFLHSCTIPSANLS